jgi:CelD/BcsL family acetyltransferase involved in cellulose biosynthesis
MIAMNSPIPVPTITPGINITMAVFDSFDQAGLSREEWDEFILSIGGSLYVTYDWCRIWWRHYSSHRRLRLFVFREGTRLIGLAPMFIDHIRLGFITIRLAKRVGSDFTLTMFALPLAPNHTEAIYRRLVESLIGSEQCDAIWFGFMPGDDLTTAGLRDACQSLRDLVTIVRDAPAGPHILFNLPSNFDLYLAGLEKRQRQNYRRDKNLLDKNFEMRGDVLKDPLETLAAFLEFKTLHTSQWEEEGKSGHFGDWPDSEAFNADLANELSRLGRFRMVRMFAGEEVVALQYAFIFGDCCYWRLPARTVRSEFKRFALGRLGLIQLINTMIDNGVCRIEAGAGHYEYKLRLGGEEMMLRSILIAANRAGSVLRARLFLRLSGIIHLTYYRIWFGRIAPHLPFRWPLWRYWIRLRM